MDDVLRLCLEEIALEGLSGCPWSTLWTRVQALDLTGFDAQLQAFLQKALLSRPELRFVRVVPKPEKGNGKTIFEPPAELQAALSPFALGRGIWHHASWQLDTHSHAPSEAWVIDESVRAIADAALRQHMLGLRPDAGEISSMQYAALEVIGRGRAAGLTQSSLSKSLGLDPRSTFHQLRMLEAHRLISRQARGIWISSDFTDAAQSLHGQWTGTVQTWCMHCTVRAGNV